MYIFTVRQSCIIINAYSGKLLRKIFEHSEEKEEKKTVEKLYLTQITENVYLNFIPIGHCRS